MRSFTVLNGIVSGMPTPMAFCLTAALSPGSPHELPRLPLGLVASAVLTAASGGSFPGRLQDRPWPA